MSANVKQIIQDLIIPEFRTLSAEIKRLDEKGDIEAIEIVDFKERDDSEMASDYEKQLKLYAIASMHALGLNPKKATVHHLDNGSTSEVDISPEALNIVSDGVMNCVDNIMKRVFPRFPDTNKCNGCDWKYICPKRAE